MEKHSSSSSSLDGDQRNASLVDDKKRKRMISNRESARRSRMRREQHLKDLTCQINLFRSANGEIGRKIGSVSQQFMTVELENQALIKMRDELTKRLESLEIVSSYLCTYPEDVPRNNSQPWLLPCQSMPLVTSVGTFQF
ncbi:hypothetical protein U1Q18_044704 [Sarracenia purpurea var. burkii]